MMRRADTLVGGACGIGLLVLLAIIAHERGHAQGFAAARYTCPPVQQGERLRYVEQSVDTDTVICVYARTSGASFNYRKAVTS